MAAPFATPLRYIFESSDLAAFQTSPCCDDLLKFIAAINHAVTDQKNSADVVRSPAVEAILSTLEQAAAWVNDFPPQQQPMRYGNKAFRQWHTHLLQQASRLCVSILDTKGGLAGAEVEATAYLCDSFGNATRIDYGTGHESSFIIFLYVLARLNVLTATDLPALGLKVFPGYLTVCRKLQRTYLLEPAGSHGVWSLDDYQFLVFLFGSAQLMNHKHIKPRSIHTADILEGFQKEYMYLSAIQFISQVKVGAPFAEHSPLLNDISEMPTWAKVNEGLAKLYRTEVLGKLPVVQHLVFGSLFSASWTPSRTPIPSEAVAHMQADAAAGTAGEAAARAMLRTAATEQVPVDEPEMATAPWVTRPPMSSATITGVAPWAVRDASNPSTTRSPTSAEAFVAAFGDVPHARPGARRSSGSSPLAASPAM